MPPLNPGEDWFDYGIRNGYISPQSFERGQSDLSYRQNLGNEIQRTWENQHHNSVPAINSANSSLRNPNYFSWGTVSNQVRPRVVQSKMSKVNEDTSKRIKEGVIRILSGKNKRSQERWKNINVRTAKKGDYLRMLDAKRQESLSATQIIQTEFPIQLNNVSERRFGEIAQMGYCDEISSSKDRNIFFCGVCTVQTGNRGDYFFQLGHLYCGEHVPRMEYCVGCKNFRNTCRKIETYDDQSVWACESCIQNRNHCGICSSEIGTEFIERRRCLKCIQTEFVRESPYRKFSHDLKWTGRETGKIYKSKRMWSCELEALSPDPHWALVLIKSMPKEMGIGQDGSVGVRNQSPYGFEVQTPRLSGARGEELIERVIASIRDVKPKLDETCGMHVHLDGKGLMPESRSMYPQQLIQLMKSYIVFEDVIMSLLPYSRRGNDFCRPLAESFQLSEIDMVETIQDLEKLWYKEETHMEIRDAKGHHYHSSRYFGANFHSLLANRHFEVRFHSGTLNRKKILEWANLHALILDACAESKITTDFIQEYLATSRLTERTNLLFEIIGLAESSRQWFRNRQKEFGNKKNGEDEVKHSGRKQNAISTSDLIGAYLEESALIDQPEF